MKLRWDINDESDTGINSRMGAEVLVENNYFKDFQDPLGFWYSPSTGYWNVSGNVYDNCTGRQPTVSTCSYTVPYIYTLDPITPGDTPADLVPDAGPQ